MATKLSPDRQDQQFNNNRTVPRPRYRHAETVNAATGGWVLIPAGIGDLLVSVDPAAGTGRVEYTQDDVEAVEAGTAEAAPWDAGDVSQYTHAIMANAVTAIRCVAAGGATTFKVTA